MSRGALTIVVVGSCGAGKSSLIFRATTGRFEVDRRAAMMMEQANANNFNNITNGVSITTPRHNYTLGIEMTTKQELYRNEKTWVSIWEVGGQIRFRPLAQQLLPQAKGVVFVYDCTSDASFQELTFWKNEVNRSCPSAAMVLVSTKNDVVERLAIKSEDGQRQAAEWNIPYIQASAVTGVGVDTIFSTILAAHNKLV